MNKSLLIAAGIAMLSLCTSGETLAAAAVDLRAALISVARNPSAPWLASVAPAVPLQRPDLSGTWRLDATASRIEGEEGLVGLGAAAPEWLHVTHARNGALILSSRVNGAQPRFYMIGGASELPAPGGELQRMTVATSWEGDELVSTGTTEFEGAPYVTFERMSLAEAGAVLRIEVTTTRSGDTTRNLLVYRRQSR